MNASIISLLERSAIPPRANDAIDMSAWIGQYPFRHIPRSTLADRKILDDSLGIARAVVSPFEAVFCENGLDAYENWADELSNDAHFELWPVVRPGSIHRLEKLLDRHHPRGLRLIPSYHNYHLHDRDLEPIMEIARQRHMIVQIFSRLADERWHWMLKVTELPFAEIEHAAAVYNQQPLLISGLNQPQTLTTRMRQHPALYADISRVRGPVFGMDRLIQSMPEDRLVFGSLWPVQIVEATLWQVTSAKIDPRLRNRVLRDNAQSLLSAAAQGAR